VIACIIRSRRRAKGWKQRHLAQRLETDQSQVRMWEEGKVQPGAYYLGRLADVFGCSVDELMGRKGAVVPVRCEECELRKEADMFGTKKLECRRTETITQADAYCFWGVKEEKQNG
jgi:transcriptional regulator with XRE-family HTH domain